MRLTLQKEKSICLLERKKQTSGETMLDARLEKLVRKVTDKSFREKICDLLEKPTFEVGGEVYSGLPLGLAPAGRSHHHAYPGGYIEHVVSSANIALALCDSVEKIYNGKINRDLVVAGMLVHDLFKPHTYTVNRQGHYGSTPLADYLDHLSIGIAELVRRGFPLELVHIVAAHHGEYGPTRPRTIEALVCHLADFTDSRLNGEVLDAASYLARRTGGQELSGMTSKEAFEIVHSKAAEGWEGVASTLEKISRKRKAHKT
jgi:7,8-dihydroneopterin 2',3'-cyclic phosphate phosphodiesterase